MGSSLPPGVANLSIGPSKDPAGGQDIEIAPANTNAARISVHIVGEMVYVVLGQSTFMEFFVNSLNREQRALATLREVSQAVIDGSFTEDVWSLGNRNVRAVGILKLSVETKRLRFVTIYNPFRKTKRTRFNYEPYFKP